MGEKTVFIFISVFVAISAIALFVVNKPKEISVPIPVVPTEDNGSKEQALVETYLRNNIKTLAPEAPVLGGSWYVVSITVDAGANTGVVTYEDGHIAGKASFSYKIQGESVVVENIEKAK